MCTLGIFLRQSLNPKHKSSFPFCVDNSGTRLYFLNLIVSFPIIHYVGKLKTRSSNSTSHPNARIYNIHNKKSSKNYYVSGVHICAFQFQTAGFTRGENLLKFAIWFWLYPPFHTYVPYLKRPP